jgi:hypothetical protein
MARYFIGRHGDGAVRIDSDSFARIVGGTAILSVKDYERVIELELSENLHVLVRSEGSLLEVVVSSTLKVDEIRPVRVRIISDDHEPIAAVVEQRLFSLRQVYAIIILLESNREEKMIAALRDNPDFDLEQLLDDEERLELLAAGVGTFWLAVGKVGKAIGKAPRAALIGLDALFTASTKPIVRYVDAITRLKEAEAEYKEGEAAVKRQEVLKTEAETAKALVDVERSKFALEEDRRAAELHYVNEIQKIKDPNERKLVNQIFSKRLSQVNPSIPRLPPPA